FSAYPDTSFPDFAGCLFTWRISGVIYRVLFGMGLISRFIFRTDSAVIIFIKLRPAASKLQSAKSTLQQLDLFDQRLPSICHVIINERYIIGRIQYINCEQMLFHFSQWVLFLICRKQFSQL